MVSQLHEQELYGLEQFICHSSTQFNKMCYTCSQRTKTIICNSVTVSLHNILSVKIIRTDCPFSAYN